MGERCSGEVYKGRITDFRCTRQGKLLEEGRWWCRQHAPTAAWKRVKLSWDKHNSESNARRVLHQWAVHGPELLRAARVFAAGSRPCSHPIGMAGSPARQSWEDQCFAFGVLMREIAACEEIEGVTKRC